MNLNFLKKLRVFTSLLFFVLTSLLFLDFTSSLSTALFSSVTYMEFIPSLLKFVRLLTFTSIGFLAIILLTVFFGRAYCSSVCPLGTLQDIISFIAKIISKKKKYKFSKPLNKLSDISRNDCDISSRLSAIASFDFTSRIK